MAQTLEQKRAKKREQARKWRTKNPDGWRAIARRSMVKWGAKNDIREQAKRAAQPDKYVQQANGRWYKIRQPRVLKWTPEYRKQYVASYYQSHKAEHRLSARNSWRRKAAKRKALLSSNNE